MNNEDEQLADIVQQAYSIDAPAKRDEFLDKSCKRRPSLKSRLQMIVDAIPESGADAKPETKSPLHNSEHSVLREITPKTQPISVVLDDSIDQSNDPIIQPTSAEMPKTIDSSRYQLQGEIARGGMGAVLKGRDIDLGRNLAVKVLLDAHKDNPLAVQRFIEEAQIGGQLQHPGVAPVYELGQFEDRRPFFTMKLVKGDTLAYLLTGRYSVQHNRAKLLGIFEQVCQTIAYAHSRRVIHRDLKPANIMVGAFGEVQVMDWGLAKVLPVDGKESATNVSMPADGKSVIATLRSPDENAPVPTFGSGEQDGSQTQMGRALGTPAYMPPEQAMGKVDRMDRRSDVFGLGAILCEILTGQPPYVADDLGAMMRLASRGQTEECFQRLDTCDADPQLVELTKHCLQYELADRPADAGEVSRRVSQYLESVEDQIRETEIQVAEEAARVVEERKRRKAVLSLSAGILAILLLGGGGWMWNQSQLAKQRKTLLQDFDKAIGHAKLREQLAETDNLITRQSELESAFESVQQAIQLADGSQIGEEKLASAKSLAEKIVQSLETTKTEIKRQDQNSRLRQRLAFIRTSHAESEGKVDFVNFDAAFEFDAVNQRYLDAFREVGIDVSGGDVKAVGELIKQSEIRDSLIAGMDHWISAFPKHSTGKRLVTNLSLGRWAAAAEIAEKRLAADPSDTLRYVALAPALILSGQTERYKELCVQMRDQFVASNVATDSGRTTKTCLMLDDALDIAEIPSVVFEKSLDGRTTEKRLLGFRWSTRAMLEYRRGNLQKANESIVHAQSAEMDLRAKSYVLACQALIQHGLGATDQAKETLNRLRDSIEAMLDDDTLRGHPDTAIALVHFQEAESKLNDVRPDSRINQFIKNSEAPTELPAVLVHEEAKNRLFQIVQHADDSSFRKQVRQAIANGDSDSLLSLAESARAKSQPSALLVSLGSALRITGHTAEAADVLQSAALRAPGDFWVHYELAKCARDEKKYGEALNFARTANAIRPTSTAARLMLISALSQSGRNDESVSTLKRLINDVDISPGDLANIGQSLLGKELYDQARLVLEKVTTENPDDVDPLSYLSNCHFHLNRLDDAQQIGQLALQLDPDNLPSLLTVGAVHLERKEWDQSLRYFDRAVEAHPASWPAHYHRSGALQGLERLDEAAQALQQALRILPNSVYVKKTLLNLRLRMARSNEQGKSNTELDQLAKAASSVGPADAIKQAKTVLGNNPSDNKTRVKLASLRISTRQYEKAIEHTREVIKRDPKSMRAWFYQGIAQTKLGNVDDAIESLRKAIELRPDFPGSHVRLAMALEAKLDTLQSAEQNTDEAESMLNEVVERYRAARDLGGEVGASRQGLIDALRRRGDHQEADALEAEFDELPDKEATDKLFRLAAWQMREQRDDAARISLEKALTRSPNHQLAKLTLIDVYLNLGMYDAALKQSQKLQRNAPESLVAKQLVGELSLLNGQYDRSLKILREVAAQDPKARKNTLAAIAQVLFEKGESDEANTWCREQIKRHPDNLLLRAIFAYQLALSRETQGDESRLDEALRHGEIADNTRKSASALMSFIPHSLGLVYYRLGRWQESIDKFEEAYQMNDRRFDGHFLAMAYHRIGNSDMAKHWYEYSKAEYAKYEQLLPSQKAISREAAVLFQPSSSSEARSEEAPSANGNVSR